MLITIPDMFNKVLYRKRASRVYRLLYPNKSISKRVFVQFKIQIVLELQNG